MSRATVAGAADGRLAGYESPETTFMPAGRCAGLILRGVYRTGAERDCRRRWTEMVREEIERL